MAEQLPLAQPLLMAALPLAPQPPQQPPLQQPPQITPEVYAFMLNHMARYPKARTKFGDTMLTMLRIVDHDPEEIARIMRASARNAYKKSVELGILAELGGSFSEDIFNGVVVEYSRMLRDSIKGARERKARNARPAPYWIFKFLFLGELLTKGNRKQP